MKKLLIAVCLVAAGATAYAGDLGKAGKWENTMVMEMEGSPVKMPPVKTTTCLTEEEMKDAEKGVPKSGSNDCKATEYKVDGRTVTWKVKCSGQTEGTGEGKLTYTDESYDGVMTMETAGYKMKMKMSGKWLGACTK
jgi:hypothetical protein